MTGPDLVVGFDLDMTLLDTRPGIAATWAAVSAHTGVPIDTDAVVERLGPPLEEEAARWFPPAEIAAAVALYRAYYPELAVPSASVLPGAAEALAAVHHHGGRVLVVTAKNEPHALLHLEHFGLPVDVVIGGVWAEQKGAALAEHGATVFVGDHLGDLRGARSAGAAFVAVTTGPVGAEDFAAAGAATIHTDLTHFPAWLDEHVLDARLALLEDQLKQLDSVLVAFSGGADSAFVLAAAVRALGPERVSAATAISPSLPSAELDAAADFAASLGVRHHSPGTNEMARDGYRANAGDRCYFCKAELLDVLGPLADTEGIAAIATGTNADDIRAGFRPGIRAAHERGAVTPLADAGFTKSQVRAASRRWGLRTWDKPAAACLSSRVAYGISITPARLSRVDRAEQAVRQALADAGHAASNLRVRDLGDRASVEVDAALVGVAAELPALDAGVRGVGFDEVEVDPRGFRSGSMNELLPNPERYR